jgi:dihydroorotase
MSDRLDLLIRGGTVLDPGSRLDERLDLGVSNGRIQAIGPDLAGQSAGRACSMRRLLCHAGPDRFAYTRVLGRQRIRHGHRSALCKNRSYDSGRCRLGGGSECPGAGALHHPAGDDPHSGVRARGAARVQKRPPTELRDITYADPERAAETIRTNPDVAVGVKLRTSSQIVGENGHEALRRAVRAAELAETRLMVHIGGSPISLEEILDALRPGHIVTHCFTGNPPCLVDERGRVRAAALRARPVRRGSRQRQLQLRSGSRRARTRLQTGCYQH